MDCTGCRNCLEEGVGVGKRVDCYEFVVESVGGYAAKEVFEMGLEVLAGKVANYRK
jgi:hypothetical protein